MLNSVNKFFTPKETSENRYYIEDFDVNVDPNNNYVAIIANQIKENSRVLDLGCAQGRFGKVLKEKKCDIVGVEIDSKALEYAEKTGCYSNLYRADITDENTDVYNILFNEKKFDYILMTDILEHVVDPTKVVCIYEKMLREGGSLLVSVPNFANICVVVDLINNQIAYSDKGILDNTHLKWYTKRSFIQWIKQINDVFENIALDCIYLGSTKSRDEEIEKISDEYSALYDVIKLNSEFDSLQLLFELKKLGSGEICTNLNLLNEESTFDVAKILSDSILGQIISNDESILENEVVIYRERLKKCEDELKMTRTEWRKCSKNWKESIESNEILNEELEKNQKGWTKCAEDLDKAQKGWTKCAEDLDKAQKGWTKCAEDLDKAQKGWTQCAEDLDKAQKGWTQCAEELKEAQKRWQECSNNWQMAVKANMDKDADIARMLNEQEEHERELKEKIEALYERIAQLEETIQPIIERDVALQKELNILRKGEGTSDI